MKESTPPTSNEGKDDDEVESDSASSSSTDFSSAEMAKQRLSPPTQVQSLSEETSSADGRMSSKILTPSNFGSEEDTDDDGGKGGDAEVISRRRILASNGIELVNNSSTDNLVASPSASVSRESASSASSPDVSPDAGGECRIDFVGCGEVPEEPVTEGKAARILKPRKKL